VTAWKPDPELERLVTTTIVHRREAMREAVKRQGQALDRELAARGTLRSGAALTGHLDNDVTAFDDFTNGVIDDVLGLFRRVYGEVPVDAGLWIRETLNGLFEAWARESGPSECVRA
jgi:hypothetical protein